MYKPKSWEKEECPMRVRALTVTGEEACHKLELALEDFGLAVEYVASGCDNYYNVLISNRDIPDKEKEELLQYFPNGHDWSDCDWADVKGF